MVFYRLIYLHNGVTDKYIIVLQAKAATQCCYRLIQPNYDAKGLDRYAMVLQAKTVIEWYYRC